MALWKFSQTAQKTNSKYWASRLMEAREELWKRNIIDAGKLFKKIDNELHRVKPKDLQDEILITKAEAHLGLWAVKYLENPQERAGYRKILEEVQTTPQLWLFVAKVLGLNKDDDIDALFAYRELLKRMPTEKNARAVLEILQKTEYSSAAAELIEVVASVLPDDITTATWSCRWALKSNHLTKAEEFARGILKHRPDHIEANRCLGCIYESFQMWTTAREHYLLSKDWIRLAVCCNHIGNHTEALQALMKVEPEKRTNRTWLYNAGWAFYKTGSLNTAVEYFQQLDSYHPGHIRQLMHAIEEKLYYPYLNDFSQKDTPLPETMPEEYKAEVCIRRGAFQLIFKRDPKSAEENFEKVATRFPMSPLPSIFLLASRVSSRDDLALDKKAFEQLKGFYGEASIYLLVRSLWLAPTNPQLAIRYLEKATKEGLTRHIPDKALAAIIWLLTNSISNGKTFPVNNVYSSFLKRGSKGPAKEDELFFEAICSSLGYNILINDPVGIVPWFAFSPIGGLLSPVSWKEVQASYYALHELWIPAIEAIQHEERSEFEEQIILQGIYQSAQKRDWQIIGKILAHELNRKQTSKPLYKKIATELQGALFQKIWNDRDYDALEQQLQELLINRPGDSHIHHNLAIVYTRWALSQDQKTIPETHLSLWERSIGHWSVVLSDTHYWKKWKKQRSQFYEDEIDNTAIDNLIDEQLPGSLMTYFGERENQVSATQAEKYLYYSKLLEQELDIMTIVRRLVRQAGKDNLPSEVLRWLSPILVKEYSDESICKTLIESLPKSKLSGHETRQIRLAFTRLSEIHVLACSYQYEVALNKLRTFENDHSITQEEQTDITDELVFVLESYSRDLMRRALWDEALDRAQEAWQIRPWESSIERLYVDASLGWAQQRLKVEDYGNAVNHLTKLKKTITNDLPLELNALLAEALALYGQEALEEEKIDTAWKRLDEALRLDSANRAARDGMAHVFRAEANEALQMEDFTTACELSQKMYEYSPTMQTATIYASICAESAIKLSERRLYQAAIEALNPALELPYDRTIFQIEKIMSAILTDQGAQLFNSGQLYAGRNATRLAVQLDPDNQIARQNLAIATRGY